MSERWLGIPLPVWILALAGGVYLLAGRAQSGQSLLSVAQLQSFTTPPNDIATTNPQPSGSAPGTSPNYSSMTGTPYDPTAVPPSALPSVLGPGISGGGLNIWQSYSPPPGLGSGAGTQN